MIPLTPVAAQPAQAERASDPYQKSLQILSGENLTPLN
jgi:hypothetical protein